MIIQHFALFSVKITQPGKSFATTGRNKYHLCKGSLVPHSAALAPRTTNWTKRNCQQIHYLHYCLFSLSPSSTQLPQTPSSTSLFCFCQPFHILLLISDKTSAGPEGGMTQVLTRMQCTQKEDNVLKIKCQPYFL